ncbi:MAG: putative NADH-ubiquinone oxidoreductase [Symbiobacteriaceae bacterium]|jgi:NADH dehydrogenase|nr:putative NADH-ubiquinone oxidoreductase [Symbiobacteriaceae bacterium]
MAFVLVAGGTGFIGSHIVQKLRELGHRVAVLTRDPARAPLPAGVEARRGDVRSAESLRSAVVGVDAVISAVQFPNHPVENPRRGHTYMAIDGEGTERLVEAARAAGVKRFIYLSGAGTRPGQTAPWFKAKLKAETAIRESGLPFTIFQPSWVYGPEDRSLNKFVTFARLLPLVPVIGSGKTKVQPIHVDDLAEVVAASVELPRAIGQTYELGGPQNLTMDEIIHTMLQTMGKRRPLLHQPGWLMKLVTAPLTLLPAPPLSPAAVDFVLMEEPVDNSAVLRDFGVRLRPLAEGLRYLSNQPRT